MKRLLYSVALFLAFWVNVGAARADDRAEAGRLVREALAAIARAESASRPDVRLGELEAAAALVQRLIRDYASTYIGLRLAAGEPIGPLDPKALEQELQAARAAGTKSSAPARAIEAKTPRPAYGVRPCDRGATPGNRRGETGVTLAEVINDCRTALAFEPGSAKRRFQLARALSERAQPGDREEAIGLLEAAAADGFTPAKAELCARYRWGIGTAKDPARAQIFCEAAASEAGEAARAPAPGDESPILARR